jgi:hypothetical protein
MKRICICLFFFLSLCALGEEIPVHGAATLMKGAVYYDSQVTYREALAFSLLKDTEALTRLVKIGHISAPTDTEQDVIVLYTGSDADSPAEFSFLSGPTTYWTLSKYLLNYSKTDITPTPSASPLSEARPSDFSTPTPEASLNHSKANLTPSPSLPPLSEARPSDFSTPTSEASLSYSKADATPTPSAPPLSEARPSDFSTPTPEASPSPSVPVLVAPKKVRHRPQVSNSEDISAGGRKIWHIVNGNRRWYYEKWPPKEVQQKETQETVSRAKLLRPGPDDPEPGNTKQ